MFDNREIGEFSDAELTAARGGGNGIRARQGAASPTSLSLTGWPFPEEINRAAPGRATLMRC